MASSDFTFGLRDVMREEEEAGDFVVTAVDGLSKPRLRFFEGEDSNGTSSMSDTEGGEERRESSSLVFADFTPFFPGLGRGTSPLAVKGCSDAANARVWRLGTKSA